MRIVYMLASLGIGGAEKQVLALAGRMAERGHTVTLVTLLPQASEEWPTALPVIHLNLHKNPLSLAAVLLRARRILLRLKPDLVHSHSFHANIFARLVSLIAGRPAVISTIHNVYEGGWHRMLAYRITDGLCAHTTAVSKAVADRFIHLKAVDANRCTVVQNAIDLREFASDSARRAITRMNLRADNEFVWLAAGRISPAKDYPNLLHAFARVIENNPNASLRIAGEGRDEELRRLQAMIGELRLSRQIEWLGLRRDLPALLDACDGFVSSAAWEGMPLTIAEAMAMEKPIVATDVGGVRELVAEAVSLVPPRNPDALAKAMIEMMRKPEPGRQAIGRASRLRIQSSFDIESRITQWEALYRSIFSTAS
ncbi:MAG TPA: glycosyltransferase [Terracidiphilus sp.]|nr:glycosyltransferase [Terracidiphilus sp.]